MITGTRIRALVLSLVVAAPVHAQEAGEAGEVRTFNVWEYRVKGNTLLERTEVERTVYPYLGPDRSLEDVEAARERLETLYKDSGYLTVLVNIPEQSVSDGVVELQVVQGEVERLRISGSRYYSLGRIREGVPSLAEGEVPYFPRVQEELEALNRASGDRRVTPVFRPGKTPGTVEAELRVKDQLPLHAGLELNDRHSRDTARLRASADLRYANLWQRNHSLSLQYQTAPQDPDDSRVLSGTYVMPLEGRDLLALYAVVSRSDVAAAGDVSVLGDSRFLGARVIRPFGASEGVFQSLTLGLDYKDADTTVEIPGGGNLNAPVDYLNFMSQYRANLVTEGLEGELSAAVNLGVRGLGNTFEEFERSRFQAQPNYLHLRLGGDLLKTFANDFQASLELRTQLASGPLVNNEQFSIGGADSVRGYFASALLGDDGAEARVELISPSFARRFSRRLGDLRLFAFADGAKVRTQEPLPGDPDWQDISSLGLGMRARGFGGLQADFSWAWPLQDTRDVDQGDSRAHFSIRYDM